MRNLEESVRDSKEPKPWNKFIFDTGTGYWTLTPKNWRDGKIAYREEMIDPKDHNEIFCSILYSFLSIQEKWSKQYTIYQTLVDNELNNVAVMKKDLAKEHPLTYTIIREHRFGNKLKKWFKSLVDDWDNLTVLLDEMGDKVNTATKENEFDLRKRLSDSIDGVSYKVASLIMMKCGYQNVVPVDIQLIRYCKQALGFNYNPAKKREDTSPKEFLAYEKRISEEAARQNVSPALFQYVIWHSKARIIAKQEQKGKQEKLF
jgi:thermostable 8-oxoguanine DNA glycosylase